MIHDVIVVTPRPVWQITGCESDDCWTRTWNDHDTSDDDARKSRKSYHSQNWGYVRAFTNVTINCYLMKKGQNSEPTELSCNDGNNQHGIWLSCMARSPSCQLVLTLITIRSDMMVTIGVSLPLPVSVTSQEYDLVFFLQKGMQILVNFLISEFKLTILCVFYVSSINWYLLPTKGRWPRNCAWSSGNN